MVGMQGKSEQANKRSEKGKRRDAGKFKRQEKRLNFKIRTTSVRALIKRNIFKAGISLIK